MRIDEIMTRDPVCCDPHTTAQAAAHLMRQHDIGILPVVFNLFSRKLMGVVTDRDLCLLVTGTGRDPAHLAVQECMTANPAACSPHEDAQAAIRLMQERQVRRLPVLDEQGRVVGVLALADLVRHGAIDPKDLYLLLKRVCEPASVARQQAEQRIA